MVLLGLFALAALAACYLLLDSGKNPTVVAVIATPMGVALGLVGGILASARTTPELAPGQQLVGGQTVLTGPPVVGSPVDRVVPVPVTTNVVAAPVPTAATSALVTLEQQGVDPALGLGGEAPKNANAVQNP